MRGAGRVVIVASALGASALLGACGSSGGKAASPPATSPGLGTAAGASATTAVSNSGVTASCPPAAVVNSALGATSTGPTTVQQPYGIQCTYSGGGPIAIKVVFQKDTPATFAAGEAAVPIATKISGLGSAAYGTTGFLAVLNGGTALRITAPLSSQAQLVALAHKILG